jgi:DNA-binding NarL/FixJ family response regulator
MVAELRVLIVGDNPLARLGLAALLVGQPGLLVAGQSAGGPNLSADVELYQPTVLAWDVGWDVDRLTDVRDVGLPTLALLNNAGQVGDAWAAGSRALVLHDTDPDALAAALAAAAQGLVVFSPTLAAAAFAANAPAPETPAEALTPREREVLQLLAEGLPNKTIAKQLGITDHTVKFHVNAIMSKLDAQSRTEAVVRATRQGLILL